ncbi:MAG: cation transporter [Candidatus Aenigmarchaeota archaeon]|nr:cation transporter [Candidatus Aenigmarchaeota archaeon]
MSKPKFQEEIISIKGMHCKSCSDKIESVIGSLDGVESIKVTLIENNAFVKFDPAKNSFDEINSEIASIGYSTGSSKKKDMTLKQGIAYGLVPHIGCIGFIAASILGVTVAVNFFKPLLMNPWFFHILVLMSIGFATISSSLYLRKNGLLSASGAKRKWKYLSTMYGSTVGINLVLFMVIFPLLANVSLSSPTGAVTGINELASMRLQVDIPCPGHAPLISEELKTISGVEVIQFSYPNLFDVKYDSSKTTKQEILSLDVFATYKATVVGDNEVI